MGEHKHHDHCCEHYEMDEFETYMAMTWGTPSGIATILLALGGFLISIGVFLWLLHLANIIK